MSRSFWVRVVLPEEPPSEAIKVSVATSDSTVYDLKVAILSATADGLPGKTSPMWITLRCLPSESGSMSDGDGILDGCADVETLDPAIGTKQRHVLASIRQIVLATGQVKKPSKPYNERTLFEKGIAGAEEPEHIKNAMEMTDLYPGGVLPRSGDKNDFSLKVIIKLLFVFVILSSFYLGLMYIFSRAAEGSGKVKGFASAGKQEL